MMYRVVTVFLVILVCSSFSNTVDSSEHIFDDTKIHAYELQFYYPNWADSLKYYKSLPDEDYIPARFVYRISLNDSIVLDSIGVRYKGNSSYNFAANSPKKPFKFRFNKYIKNQLFFGIERLNFSNGAKDPTMMREKISYDIIGQYMPAPRTAFASISIEGNLIGLYTQIEQVDKLFLKRHFTKANGNLYKSSDNGSSLLYKGPNQSSYESNYELKTNEKDNDWSSFIDMIDKLNNTSTIDFTKIAGSCLSLDNICRYLAFNMVVSNFDSYTGSGRNYYFYDNPPTNTYTLIPWDLNLSFGAYTNKWNVTTANVVSVNNLAQRPLNKRILENDSLKQVYLSYIKAMIDGPANADSIKAMVDRWKPFIDSLVQADPNKLHTYEDFIKNIDNNLTIMDGLVRSSVPGITLFSKNRNIALRTQLDTYLPVTNLNRHISDNTLNLHCYQSKNTPVVIVKFGVPRLATSVRVEMYNCQGILIKALTPAVHQSGIYTLTWNTHQLSSGTYLVKLITNTEVISTRTILLKSK